METLSQETIAEIKRLLPELREKVEKEFSSWPDCKITFEFCSDDEVLRVLPLAARDYVILSMHINPARQYVEPDKVIYFLNTRLFNSLPQIVSHALRLLAIPR